MPAKKILDKANVKSATVVDDAVKGVGKTVDDASSSVNKGFKNTDDISETQPYTQEDLFGKAGPVEDQLSMGADEGYDNYFKRVLRVAENPQHFGQKTTQKAKQKMTELME